jgi:hypothetical protein
MKLSKEEINFLIECLEWNKKNYSDKANKYRDIKEYQEKISSPKLKKMDDIINKLKSEKTKIKD